MWAARTDDGYLFMGLTRECAETLRGVPMLLESSDPRVRQRLLPETYDDPDEEVQWRRHAAPELERLFASRAQIVRKDLGRMRQLKGADSWVLYVPDAHCNAWLATLNAARLSLFALNELTAAHLERGGDKQTSDKQKEAIQRIHFMAELQSVLMGDYAMDEDPSAADEDEDAGDGGGLRGDELDGRPPESRPD